MYIYIVIYKPHINHRPKIYNTYMQKKEKESYIILYLLFYPVRSISLHSYYLKGSMILWEWRYQSLLKTFINRHLFLVWLLKIMLQQNS